MSRIVTSTKSANRKLHVYLRDPLFEMYFEYNYKCQKNIKITCVYLDMLRDRKVVSAKTDMFCILCKKTNFNVKINFFLRIFFCLFYTEHKMSVLCEISRAHIRRVSVHAIHSGSVLSFPYFLWL
jgi:hypothetical protein